MGLLNNEAQFFSGDGQRLPAAVRQPGGLLLPAHGRVVAQADLRDDAPLRHVACQARVREGAPGTAPALRHPGLHCG